MPGIAIATIQLRMPRRSPQSECNILGRHQVGGSVTEANVSVQEMIQKKVVAARLGQPMQLCMEFIMHFNKSDELEGNKGYPIKN